MVAGVLSRVRHRLCRLSRVVLVALAGHASPGSEWIYLSSGLGMTYGVVETVVNAAVGDRFDNVFVTPQAYKAFLQTGTWPDKTMFILEVRSSTTKGSIN